MMLWRDKPTADEVFDVARRMRDRDYEELSSVTWTDTRAELAHMLADQVAGLESAVVVGTARGGAIGIYSWVPIHPGVWQIGFFATDDFPTISGGMTKLIIRGIVPALGNAGAHRVFCRSLADYAEVHRWAQFCGLSDSVPLKGYGKSGQDYVELSYTKAPGQVGMKWLGPGVIGGVDDVSRRG